MKKRMKQRDKQQEETNFFPCILSSWRGEVAVPLFYKEKKSLNIKLEFKTLASLASGFFHYPTKIQFP